MNVNLFDFELPEHLIAQSPLQDRTQSRLLSLNKATGEVGHHHFNELKHFLNAGDTLVLNDTKVLPARLFGVKTDTGANVEVLLLKSLDSNRWETLVRPAKKLKVGAKIHFGATELSDEPLLRAEVISESDMGGRVLQFHFQGIFNELLDQLGEMPLPPYIKQRLAEKDRYQTVYAKHEGSAAAPTAGLHFSKEYLQQLEQKGVHIAYITLHVGLGTFRPVSVERVEEHEMHAEYFDLSEHTAEVINRSKEQGGKIFAVGTTSARTLETVARQVSDQGLIQAASGWTNIFMYPGYEFKLVDGLLTNFHLPKSTLMMLISAFANRDQVMRAYEEAIREEYRFFSFGDAMLLHE